MQIEYNAQEKSLTINDGLKTQYLLVKAMLGILLINAVIITVIASKTGFGSLDYVWVVFGLIASYALYNLIFKKSTQQEIATKDIDHLQIRNIRGKSHFSLVLKNGKTRNLAVFSKNNGEKRMIQLFNKAGISKR